MMATTAFVSHSDCARHDTGWRHPDHQGRLPALVRAVYRDMLTLHGHLLEVEAEPATESQLRRVHSPDYLGRVRDASEAAARGEPVAFEAQVVVSGASWDAALAAAGTAVTGVEAVLAGRARNAFCAARPAGYAARGDGAGGFAILNNVAVAVRHLRDALGVERVLVVQWGGVAASGTAGLLAEDAGVRTLEVRGATPATAPEPPGHAVVLPAGTNGSLFAAAFEGALREVVAEFRPQFVVLSAGFDVLSADPLGTLALEPADIHPLTRLLVDLAEGSCDGRLVSVLEGGYDAPALGRAVVQHVRALAGLPPA
jgi:acetoin utilization deacetylase AcuC-like enzyme